MMFNKLATLWNEPSQEIIKYEIPLVLLTMVCFALLKVVAN